MQLKTTKILCPDCNTPLVIEVNQLLQGAKFTCSSCNATVGLSLDSKSTLEKAVKSDKKASQ